MEEKPIRQNKHKMNISTTKTESTAICGINIERVKVMFDNKVIE